MVSHIFKKRWAVLFFSAVLCLASCGEKDRPASVDSTLEYDDASIETNNRGVALMGRFDYEGAHQEFEKLVAAQPGWADASVNLAIATLNRQHENDELVALELLTGVLQNHPNHLRAHYTSGLLRLYVGEVDAAFDHFAIVAEGDTEDAYAAYYLGQALVQQGDLDVALTWFKKAIAADPYLRSAYYGAALAFRRLKRADEARGMLADYERFKDNPRARLVEFKYTRMGPKAEVLALGAETLPVATRPVGPIFESAADTGVEIEVVAPVMTTADIDSDGDQDIFVGDIGGDSYVLLQQDGSHQVWSDHPLSGISGIAAAVWGDIDNDGLLDVYLCRIGKNSLLRQSPAGIWTDITDASGADDSEKSCADAALFDADHDGDLDIFTVNHDGANELINNNRDGTFRMLAADQGIGGGDRDSIQVLANDLDQDRDTDIIIIHSKPPHDVYFNDRLWEYREAAGFDAFRMEPLTAAAIADADANGQVEIYALTDNGVLKKWLNESGEWVGYELLTNLARINDIVIQDFDGDGRPELLATGETGWQLFALNEASTDMIASDTTPIANSIPVIDGHSAGPSLYGITGNNSLVRWAPGPGRFEFLSLVFSGKEEVAESMRSNRSGIGTQIALRMGTSWAIADTFAAASTPGQSLQPLAVGLGGHEKADFIAINWSDGVYQTELDLKPGSYNRISETQRQLSSCPVLFAWDGERYRFVSDVLGVGGLGFFVSPGQYVRPRPWEYFRLPDGLLVERDGHYQLKLTEPMEENAYLDSARLHVYDLPAGWSMIMDDRMVVAGPPATGRPIFYRTVFAPVSAVNDRGNDVWDTIARRDLVAAPAGDLDRRFIGRLKADHSLTLEFDQALSADDLVLAIDGWVEYPYSQTVFAAWQAGAEYSAPTLEARDADGVWHVISANFGYPAGMPREMALPLSGIPIGSKALRLSTNMEVYWDRIRVVREEPLQDVTHSELSPSVARLASSGYPLRSNGAQRLPGYDYDQRSQFWDTRYLSGYYTRFGPVEELIERSDGALVIIGPGEEVHMAFAMADIGGASVSRSGPDTGRNRQFVLEVRGYAKDMDMYTRDGGTVEPLPLPATADTVRRESLHTRYNTRFQAGR